MLRAYAGFHGPSDSTARRIDAALAAFPFQQIAIGDRPYFTAATAYAYAGRPERARAMLEQYQREVRDTALRRLQQTDFHHALGEVALAEHKPLVALAEFRRSDDGGDGYPAGECAPCALVGPMRVFDLADMADSATAR